ncbi:MAG TPA: N-acetylmuramoyl-L-alanine amidase, partial [Terriglobales bacterium]|nr:N-acetylmuramoyl-L-alanine amidase [Terriglobales bacterium]
TPEYTRIAIDLSQEVTYNADRIDNPDRIYFDLHNAKLSSVLVGKSFPVEDGFLKKIRVAQFQPDQARVVLEVADVSDYSVFLLPNPYRLIIDIHGKKKPAKLMAENKPSLPVTGDTELPRASVPAVPALGEEKGKSESQPVAPSGSVAGRDKGGAPASLHGSETRATQLPVHRPRGTAAQAPSVGAIAKGTAKPEAPVLTAKAVIPAAPPKPEKPAEKKAEERKLAVERTPAEDAKITNGPLPTRGKKGKKAARADSAHEAEALEAGDRTLIRALGLKIGRIVVDAGHGGHDTGTIAPNGLLEKDLVLDVALRLGKLLETRLGADVTYTRDDDTFIPLETRTAIANQKQADLFISVHANSSSDAKARGVETYYLNFTTSKDALEVAARENSVSDQSIHELQDLVKKIALKDKIDESKEFAADVQQSLYGGLSKASPGIRNRGVKKAPFIVLIGANMPSILAEISFVSNPTDAKKLQTPEWRQKIAESLYHGVAKYVSGLSGLRVAAEDGSNKKTETAAARP